jgi:hypothetical protein
MQDAMPVVATKFFRAVYEVVDRIIILYLASPAPDRYFGMDISVHITTMEVLNG